jgi:kynurenine formamidase
MKKLLIAVLCVSGCTYTVNLDETELIDLSHPLEQGIPVYPGGKDFKLTRLTAEDAGYYANSFEMGEHTGTHIDAPVHFFKGRTSVDQISPWKLVTKCYVIKVDHEVKTHDYQIGATYIERWETQIGRIEPGSVVLFYTGWQARWREKDKYLNKGEDGQLHFPGLSKEAAELLRARKVAGVGIDTLSVDPGNSKDFAVHKLLHEAGIYHVENLNNLDRLPSKGALIIVSPLPIRGGSGAPCRVFAAVPRGTR